MARSLGALALAMGLALPCAQAQTFLSDLNWVSETHGWGATYKDRDCLGGSIAIEGVSYAKGIGTHAQSEIVYNLGGAYGRFRADAGIDDTQRNDECGNVVFMVYCDNVLVYTSPAHYAYNPALPIDVAITGCSQLKLVADDNDSATCWGPGICGDMAVWANARVIVDTTPAPPVQPPDTLPRVYARPLSDVGPIVAALSTSAFDTSFLQTWRAIVGHGIRFTGDSNNVTCGRWLRDRLASYGLTVRVEEFDHPTIPTDVYGSRNVNVIARLPGTLHPEKVVVICGHFDTREMTPGADDNAVAVATALEGAKRLRDFSFENTIEFLCSNGHEQGHYGAVDYAARARTAGTDIVCCINLDMTAWRGSDPAPADFVIYSDCPGKPSNQLGFEVLDLTSYHFSSVLNPIYTGGTRWCDQIPFWNNGYRAVWLAHAFIYANDPEWNPHHHAMSDTVGVYAPYDQPLNIARVAIAAAAYEAVPVGAVAAAGPSRARATARGTARLVVTADGVRVSPGCGAGIAASALYRADGRLGGPDSRRLVAGRRIPW